VRLLFALFGGAPPAPIRLALLWVLLASCASSAQFDGRVYKGERLAFEVPPVPTGWRRIDVSDASLAFRDDAHEASILVNGRCGHKDDDTPLVALTKHLIIGTTEREFVSEKLEPLDRREALHTILKAKLDGVLMQYDIFVMKKDGCIYDLVYVSSPDKFADGAPVFEQFARGFRATGSGGS
jgi:hypothetical protein